VRIITKKDSNALAKRLRNEGYSVTLLDAEGNTGPVNVLFTLIKRANVPNILPIILNYNPYAVYSIEDVRHVSDQSLTVIENERKGLISNLIRGLRK
jgi:uncharacterized protein YebE (UPF0316 family)